MLLTGIAGPGFFAQGKIFLRKKIEPAGTLRENFTIAEGEIQRLNRLLTDVMDFERSRPLCL